MLNSNPSLQRRAVTRGYVFTVLLFAAVLGISLTVCGWGLLFFLTDTELFVAAGAPRLLLPVLVLLLAVAMCFFGWRQSISLLWGSLVLPWGWLIATFLTAVVLWCGSFLLVSESFMRAMSWAPFVLFALPQVFAQLCAWVVVLRRVYTERATPKWWWEKHDERAREIERLDQLWERS